MSTQFKSPQDYFTETTTGEMSRLGKYPSLVSHGVASEGDIKSASRVHAELAGGQVEQPQPEAGETKKKFGPIKKLGIFVAGTAVAVASLLWVNSTIDQDDPLRDPNIPQEQLDVNRNAVEGVPQDPMERNPRAGS